MGAFWIGLKFKIPLIWIPIESCQPHYQLNRYDEISWTTQLMATQGHRKEDEDNADVYDLTKLHQQHTSVVIKDDPEHSKEST